MKCLGLASFAEGSKILSGLMNNHSVSRVHLQDEESLWSYYNSCGLSPALKLSDSGPLDYRKITYSLGDMFVCSTASSSGWGFEKQHNTDVFFISYTHKGESTWEMNKQGRIHASQQLCVVDSARLVQGQFSRDTHTDTIMIEASALTNQLELTQGFPCIERLEFQPLLPNETKVWPLLNSIIHCIQNGMSVSQECQSPLAISYLKQALISTIIQAVPHNYSSMPRRKAPANIPRHVGRAIEYIHAHASEDILISDIALYACTSVRNLQLGFKSYKNMTPMQYLREARLTGAHSELINESIRCGWQAIALRWGFSDVGLFSRYYKDKFGESPFQAQYKIKGYLELDRE